MTTRLIELAKQHELEFAVDVFTSYSSDAATALRAGYDVRHALIGPGVFASWRTHPCARAGRRVRQKLRVRAYGALVGYKARRKIGLRYLV